MHTDRHITPVAGGQLEKVAIAMHCNLKPLDIALAVLVFNYQAHDAQAYKVNTSATSASRFSNLDLLKDSSNSTIRRRFQASFSLHRSKICILLFPVCLTK